LRQGSPGNDPYVTVDKERFAGPMFFSRPGIYKKEGPSSPAVYS